jgi:hypothetical protein
MGGCAIVLGFRRYIAGAGVEKELQKEVMLQCCIMHLHSAFGVICPKESARVQVRRVAPACTLTLT